MTFAYVSLLTAASVIMCSMCAVLQKDEDDLYQSLFFGETSALVVGSIVTSVCFVCITAEL